MALKKVNFKEDEEALFDNAVIYKRGEYWHMRMWLPKEHKYARFSLKTRNKSTAKDKAELHYYELKVLEKSGKTYFSQTTKMGVEMYLEERKIDVASGIIVKGRFSVIRTHLNHWLDVIGKDTKLKELERTDCANYFYERTKTKKSIPISQTTVENEQSTALSRHNHPPPALGFASHARPGPSRSGSTWRLDGMPRRSLLHSCGLANGGEYERDSHARDPARTSAQGPLRQCWSYPSLQRSARPCPSHELSR
jgi:hypothetical protein